MERKLKLRFCGEWDITQGKSVIHIPTLLPPDLGTGIPQPLAVPCLKPAPPTFASGLQLILTPPRELLSWSWFYPKRQKPREITKFFSMSHKEDVGQLSWKIFLIMKAGLLTTHLLTPPYIFIHKHIHTDTYTQTYTCTHIHKYIHRNICTHTYINIHTGTYTETHIWTSIHMCMRKMD